MKNLYFSGCYLFVMHLLCGGGYGEQKQNPVEDQRAQLCSTADSCCVPSFPCRAAKLYFFIVCTDLELLAEVKKCKNAMCKTPARVVERDKFSDFLTAKN